MLSFERVAFIGILLALLSACGFQPVYGDHGRVAASQELAEVQIAPIDDRIGQMLRNNLLDSMNPTGSPSKPLYRLVVRLTESKSESSVQKTQIATRANLTMSATYQIVRIDTGTSVGQGTTSIVASYDVVTDDFATLAAEGDARTRVLREVSDDITQRVAAQLKNPSSAPRR